MSGKSHATFHPSSFLRLEVGIHMTLLCVCLLKYDAIDQKPKPILLDVGTVKPIEWVPYILPLQIARVGNLWIIAVPGTGSVHVMLGRVVAIVSILHESSLWSWATIEDYCFCCRRIYYHGWSSAAGHCAPGHH
jgi:hypothetical protein